MASRKPFTSSDAQTPNKNDEVNTVTIVRNPYIILNGNTIDNKADEEMIEAKVDNALLISTQFEAEVFTDPWIDQE